MRNEPLPHELLIFMVKAGLIRGRLEASWGPLGAAWEPLGGLLESLGGSLGASWASLVGFWGDLGRISGDFGVKLTSHCFGMRLGSDLESSWGRLGDVLGPSWRHLGSSWGVLGFPLEFLGPSWGHLGGSRGHLEVTLDILRRISAKSWKTQALPHKVLIVAIKVRRRWGQVGPSWVQVGVKLRC